MKAFAGEGNRKFEWEIFIVLKTLYFPKIFKITLI